MARYDPVNRSDDSLLNDKAEAVSGILVGQRTFTSASHRRWWERIGVWGLLTFCLGTCCLIGASAIVAFFWKNATDAAGQSTTTNSAWRSVVFRGWATRIVTICTATIRVAVAAQASVVTSMVASILIERSGVPLETLPLLSIVRSLNVAPWTLLPASWFRQNIRVRLRGIMCALIIVMAVMLSLISQFTSTILLSDFSNVRILGEFSTTSVAFSLPAGMVPYVPASTSWQSAPRVYPRFAEFRRQPDIGDEFDDTGEVFRAFLPLQADQRATLRDYRGPGSVEEAQIICVRPSLVISSFGANRGFRPELFAKGDVILNGSYPSKLAISEPDRRLSFFCPLAGDYSSSPNEAGISICKLDTNATWSTPELGESFLDVTLMFNTTAPLTDGEWDDVLGVSTDRLRPISWAMSSSGPWSTASVGNERGGTVSVTACIHAAGPQSLFVHANSSRDGGKEPGLTFPIISGEPNMTGITEVGNPYNPYKEPVYDTRAIRQQLGATSETLGLDERGIMALWFGPSDSNRTFLASWTPGLAGFHSLGPLLRFNFSGSIVLKGTPSPMTDPGIILVNNRFIRDQRTDLSHIALFQDAYKSLHSPARALQALYTTVRSMQYSDAIPRFNIATDATLRFSTLVSIPTRWVGFTVILGLVALHLCVVFSATAWFVTATRETMIGNSWQAVAQVASVDVMPVLAEAASLKDKEVEELIKTKPIMGREFGIAKARASGRSEALCFRGQCEEPDMRAPEYLVAPNRRLR